MRSVFGLLVALAALVIIWLWATGRFDAAYAAIKDGTTTTQPDASTPGKPGAGAGGSWGAINNIKSQSSFVQVTPPYINIPQYVMPSSFGTFA